MDPLVLAARPWMKGRLAVLFIVLPGLAHATEMELTAPPLAPIVGRRLGRNQVDAATQANYAKLPEQRADLLSATQTNNKSDLYYDYLFFFGITTRARLL